MMSQTTNERREEFALAVAKRMRSEGWSDADILYATHVRVAVDNFIFDLGWEGS